MVDQQRFVFPIDCRVFLPVNRDNRLKAARDFVSGFVRGCAPHLGNDGRDESWTLSVRKRFIEWCPEDCNAFPTKPESRTGEYLVDYTWCEKKEGKRVLLAAESEWGRGRSGQPNFPPVEIDFEKLLAVKAPFKVLVFSSIANGNEQNSDIDFSASFALERLTNSLHNYHHHLPGEVYIFLDFPQTGKPGNSVFHSWAWTSQDFGFQEVSIKPLESGCMTYSAL